MQPLKEIIIDDIQAWTEPEVFGALKEMLPLVAPLKVTGDVSRETSLSDDLAFDSLDIMEMLAAVNEHFCILLDFEYWIQKESQAQGKPFTVQSLSQFIFKTLTESSAHEKD